MAEINTKDLSQILIKETAADTNDVFNVLICRGAKGGFAVAEHLINVLNISIPFHHVLRSLNSPSLLLVPSLHHMLPPTTCLFRIILGNLHSFPHLTRWTWRSAGFCFYVSQTSSSLVMLNPRKIKDNVKTNKYKIPASYMGCHPERDTFNHGGVFYKKNSLFMFTAQAHNEDSRSFICNCVFYLLWYIV